MLIRPAELDAIRAGSVDLAFRRWDRPRLRVGTRMRTAVGLVEVTSIDQIDPAELTEQDAARAGSSRDDLLRLLDRRPTDPVHRIGLRWAGEDPRIALRNADELSPDELAALRARLDRLDRSSPRGPWTRTVLALIAARPEVRAPDLAASLGRDTVTFKRDVRALKELGLTESFPVGYRISPRGRAVLGPVDPASPPA